VLIARTPTRAWRSDRSVPVSRRIGGPSGPDRDRPSSAGISGQASACWAISRSTAAISVSMNAICRRPASTDSRSSTGSSQAGEPLAAFDPEQVSERRLVLQPARQHRLDLVLAARPRISCSRRASRRRKIRQRSGIQTASSSPFSQQARQRPRVELVGLRAGAADTGVISD
jgi:hypothetical protein